jgi:hypothetical protein
MKNTMVQFAAFLLAGFAVTLDALGQGTISVNNINGSGNVTSTTFGLFWDVNAVPYSATPINVTILGGPDTSSLMPIVTLSGANALQMVAPGRYSDPSGGIYAITGVVPGQLATLQVLAWMGNAPTFAQANPAEEVFYPFGGTSFVPPTLFTFRNPTGGITPSSLDAMPAMLRILDVPEPGVFAMLVLGALLLGWRWRR